MSKKQADTEIVMGSKVTVTEGRIAGPGTVTGLGTGFLYVRPDTMPDKVIKGSSFCVRSDVVILRESEKSKED